MKRREFFKDAALAGIAGASLPGVIAAMPKSLERIAVAERKPLVVSTWNMGAATTEKPFSVLSKGGNVLDAIEQGINLVEADPTITSVGLGGMPDRDGHTTLDACIMDADGNCGAVVFLEYIMHPVSVARKVMEKTEHVILAGDGALQFALQNGFKKEHLTTPQKEKEYREYLNTSGYKPPKPGMDNHDTIGMLALDAKGVIGGGCSTSGMKWKLHGRVGDSPIIGAGLFVDGEVGAATSTGLGEAVIKICGTHLVVELMRLGKSPQEACIETVQRMVRKYPKYRFDGFLAGFLAINLQGEVGAFSYGQGFEYSLCDNGTNRIVAGEYMTKGDIR